MFSFWLSGYFKVGEGARIIIIIIIGTMKHTHLIYSQPWRIINNGAVRMHSTIQMQNNNNNFMQEIPKMHAGGRPETNHFIGVALCVYNYNYIQGFFRSVLETNCRYIYVWVGVDVGVCAYLGYL